MTAAVNALQQKIQAQRDANNGKLDTVSGQVQSLNDSVDELKSRIAKLDKSVQDLQAQMQNIQSSATAGPARRRTPTRTRHQRATGRPPARRRRDALPGPLRCRPTPQTPPLKETFQAGVRDYNAAKYDVATGEFQDVIHYYPLDDLAGTAQFYLGEIAYRQLNYADAVKAYNAVLEGFPGNTKAPAAQLRKGLALLQMNKRTRGFTSCALLIQRHPQTPEAAQARTKLNGMGVKIVSRGTIETETEKA